MLELEELQKEPAGVVKVGDLKKRRSRRIMLDQVLEDFALQDSAPELRRILRGLVE